MHYSVVNRLEVPAIALISVFVLPLAGWLGCGSQTKAPRKVRGDATASADAGATRVDTAPRPTGVASAAVKPEPAPATKDWDRNDYIRIADYHKRPMRGGPTAGFWLAIRKADSCLLEIEMHGGPGGRKDDERKVGGRFPKPSVDELRHKLLRKLPAQQVDTIIRDMDKCPLGYRVLVDTTNEGGD